MSQTQVIVFDGVCVLCSRWVQFVLKRDHRRVFKFASMQSHTGRSLLSQHGLNPDDPNSMLLIGMQRAHTDTDAIICIVTQFGGLWRVAALLRVIPAAWRDAGYRYMARNRYRWFGKSSTCMVPAEQIADRFLS
jgi:predicted DCC family thiol-disulfide oxidoreductase YuxK